VLVLVSLWTAPPPAQRVAPLTLHYHRRPGRVEPRRATDIAFSLLVVALVAAAWLYFS
jgi:hypothetical protein